MKQTAKQTTTRTLTDLYRAIDRQHAVTITYTDKDGVTTIRTIEPFAFSTTKAGDIRVHAMCRLAAAENPDDAERAFTVSRISEYTVHRIAYVLTRPEATSPAKAVMVVRSEKQLIARELGRDYLPTRRLTRDQTDLAA